MPGLKGATTIQLCVPTNMRECELVLSALSNFYKKAGNHIFMGNFLVF